MPSRRSLVLGDIPPAIARGRIEALSPQMRSEYGRGLTTLHGSAVLVVFLVFLASATANAQAPAGTTRPILVPDEYVTTPFGYSHPSCVQQLAEGDTLLAGGLVIQHANGAIENVPACGYLDYTASGEIVTPLTITHSYIEAGQATTTTSYGELTATWVVPPVPTSNDGQTVYFFPGFDQLDPVVSILQPVLGWNSYVLPGGWSIASWNCCPAGIKQYSSPVSVNPGDKIKGTIKSTCSPGTLSCPMWNVMTQDLSTKESTTLPKTSSEGQTFNWAFAGALEVWNLVQCSDYPPNGQLTFSGVELYDYNFNQISEPNWSVYNPASGLTPQCGYGVQVAAKQVTLDYSTGQLYGYTYTGTFPNGSEQLGTIDPQTGAFTSIATIATGSIGVTGAAAIDSAGGRFFLYAQVGTGPTLLYTVDTKTGHVSAATSPTSQYGVNIQYDSAAKTLYGYTYVGTIPNGSEQLGTIDPQTGAFTSIATIAAGTVGVTGAAAIDSAGGRFFLYAQAGTGPILLYTVSLKTGQVIVATSSTSQYSVGIQYDSASKTLYGYTYTGTSPDGSEQLGSIDPQTGAFTSIATIASGSVFVEFQSAAAIDPQGGRFFLYALSGSSPLLLYTVNIMTGEVDVATSPTSQYATFIQFATQK